MFRFPKIVVKVSCLQESLPPHPGDVVTQPKLPWQGKAVSLQVFSPLLSKFPQNSLYLLSTLRPPFSLSPSTNFWNFQDRSKNFPNTIRIYRNVESKATSAKCGSPVKPVQFRKEWPSSLHAQPHLSHPEQLNQQNIDIDIPWGFSAWNEGGWSHSSSYQDHICCWEKQETTDFKRKLSKSCTSNTLKFVNILLLLRGHSTEPEILIRIQKKINHKERMQEHKSHPTNRLSKGKGQIRYHLPYITQENRVSIFF